MNSVTSNKSVFSSAKCGLLKVALEPNYPCNR